MGAQDNTEKVLRSLHVLLSKSEPYPKEPSKVIIDKQQVIDLLAELNTCIYQIMDEYELTIRSRDKAERDFHKKGDQIIWDASRKAEDDRQNGYDVFFHDFHRLIGSARVVFLVGNVGCVLVVVHCEVVGHIRRLEQRGQTRFVSPFVGVEELSLAERLAAVFEQDLFFQTVGRVVYAAFSCVLELSEDAQTFARADCRDGRFRGDQVGFAQFEQRHGLLRIERHILCRTRFADVFADHARGVDRPFPKVDADVGSFGKEGFGCCQTGVCTQPFVRCEAAEHTEPCASHAECVTHVLIQIVREHSEEIFHRAAAVHGSSVTIDTAALGFGDEVNTDPFGVVDDLLGRVIGLFVLAAVEE